jgi:hypothetical protein
VSTVAHRAPARPAAPQHPRIDAPNRAGAYRLVRLPVVVRDVAGDAFGLYFRLNRRLRDGPLDEIIDDVPTDNLSGAGIDSSAPGNCYFAYASEVPGYYDLASVRPGHVVQVTIAFHYPHTHGVLSAHPRLSDVRPKEAGTAESPARFHQLGCGNP